MTTHNTGELVRWESTFRHWVTAGGGPGPSGENGFRVAPDLYHLFSASFAGW
jgi:putative glutathione S-transferase